MPSIPPTNRPAPVRLLVSVRDAGEATLVQAAGAHLIDAKDPERGALGALSAGKVRAIVARVGRSATVSAVADDAGTSRDLIASVAETAACGVDLVKVAVSSTHDETALRGAAEAADGRLIGVVFAEDGVATGTVERLASAGFHGVMIDTHGKTGTRLPELTSTAALRRFVAACRAHGLLCGLAGSLCVADIPALAALGPDYLGFRGGLCLGGDRRNPVDGDRVAAAVRVLASLDRVDAVRRFA